MLTHSYVPILSVAQRVTLLNAHAFGCAPPTRAKAEAKRDCGILGMGIRLIEDQGCYVLRWVLLKAFAFGLPSTCIPVYSSRCVFTPRRVRGCPSGIHIRSLIRRTLHPCAPCIHWPSSGVLARVLSSEGSLEIAASFWAVLAPFEYTSCVTEPSLCPTSSFAKGSGTSALTR